MPRATVKALALVETPTMPLRSAEGSVERAVMRMHLSEAPVTSAVKRMSLPKGLRVNKVAPWGISKPEAVAFTAPVTCSSWKGSASVEEKGPARVGRAGSVVVAASAM